MSWQNWRWGMSDPGGSAGCLLFAAMMAAGVALLVLGATGAVDMATLLAMF